MHLQWGNYEKRLVKSSNGFLRNENGTRNECQLKLTLIQMAYLITFTGEAEIVDFTLLYYEILSFQLAMSLLECPLHWVHSGGCGLVEWWPFHSFPFTQLRFFFAAFLRVAQNENVGMDLNSQIIPCCHLAQVARFMTLAFCHFFCHIFLPLFCRRFEHFQLLQAQLSQPLQFEFKSDI